MKRYFSLYQNEESKTIDIYIYGDITSWDWSEKDISSYTLSKQLEQLEDVENINIYINSYGGEVAEGLAIYNMLKRHKAKVTTYADGFACSIASVIFAAGDERIMYDTSLLMIHNAWAYTAGNANELKKQAEDLDKITQASVNAYMGIVNIEEEELKQMLDDETWINSDEALEKGFVTQIIKADEKTVATQSVRNKLFQKMVKEPEKIAVANVKFSKEDMEEIVQKEIEKLSQKLTREQELEDEKFLLEKEKEKPNNENKLNSFMKAFFNAKNEEE